ncbi:MAG: LTA synthase family protein [Desulfobacterales bacterium]|nr:LTA synthase family protein [Desulfobacterales bacterium]
MIPLPVILKSAFIGFKFDVRLALLLHFPLVLFSWINPVNIFTSIVGRRFWSSYLVIFNFIVLLFYFTDFGYYEYLEIRLDADILRFFSDLTISAQMVQESYPIILIIALLLLLIVSYGFLIKLLISKIGRSPENLLIGWKKISVVSLCVVIYIFGLYGKFSFYPLRWSDAYFSTYSFASEFALNPILHFFDTYKNKGDKYEIAKVKSYYDEIADFLGLPERNKDSLNFTRPCCKSNHNFKRPNIVMIFLESFAYYKTGISNNPLDPTPNFDSLSKDSLLFTRFYTPHSGTARSVFTALTGIPDIELKKTSSRNPLTVKQYTIVNSFKGYDKMYFLGGSASWGNIRGLLSHNISGLEIYEEGSYASPRVDVWGINDLQLFEEANQVFRNKGDNPFFAIIQTSGNHKPYTIPKDNKGFKIIQPKEDVTEYGFSSIPDFNSFRFLDHAIGYFFKIAKNEEYFDNTIFILFGDHGLKRNATHMQKGENQLTLVRFHVPLIIYAPVLIQ